jgi:hypothetical protein
MSRTVLSTVRFLTGKNPGPNSRALDRAFFGEAQDFFGD